MFERYPKSYSHFLRRWLMPCWWRLDGYACFQSPLVAVVCRGKTLSAGRRKFGQSTNSKVFKTALEACWVFASFRPLLGETHDARCHVSPSSPSRFASRFCRKFRFKISIWRQKLMFEITISRAIETKLNLTSCFAISQLVLLFLLFDISFNLELQHSWSAAVNGVRAWSFRTRVVQR